MIQSQLLQYYRTCLAEMPRGSVDEAKQYCKAKSVHEGVCWCAYNVFNALVCQKLWLTQHVPTGKVFWSAPPCYASTIPEIETALTTRINILERIVNQ